MSELLAFLKEYGPALQTPIQVVLVLVVAWIKFNDLPHIEKSVDSGFRELGERIAKMEGRAIERDTQHNH